MNRRRPRLLALCAFLALAACASKNPGGTDSTGAGSSAGSMTPAPTGTESPATGTTGGGSAAVAPGAPVPLQEMLFRVHAVNRMEVMAGNLARQRGSSREVRQFGERLAADHDAADVRVMEIARTNGIDLRRGGMGMPGGRMNRGETPPMQGMPMHPEMHESMTALRELQNLRGREFDLAFLRQTVKDHEQALSEVERFRGQTDLQPEVVTLLGDLADTMTAHANEARALLEQVESERQEIRGTESPQ